MDDIEQRIQESNISEAYHTQSGHCLSVALALQHIFGGDLISISEVPEEGYNHVALRKNGNFYDGDGKQSIEELIRYHVPKKALEEDISEHYFVLEDPERFICKEDMLKIKEMVDMLS